VAAAARARGVLFGGGRDTLLAVVVGVIACVLLFAARWLFHQDSWLALLAGREIYHSGIPHHDTLTVLTHGRTWVDQQWLAQLVMYGLFRVGGLGLVSVVHVALVTGSLAAAIVVGRRRGSSTAALMLVLVVGAVLVLFSSLVVRAQPYAYPLFVATFFLLSSDSRSPSTRVYWCLPLLVLWANLHGSAALGAGMVSLRGLTILYEGRREDRGGRRLLPGIVLTVGGPLCLLLTPYGLGAVDYYSSTLFNPDFTRLVGEWGPVTALLPDAVALFVLAGLTLWSMGREPGRLTSWERVVLVVLFAGGILALRNVVWVEFALLMVPAIRVTSGEGAPVRPLVNKALAVVVTAAVIVFVALALVRHDREFERGYPAGLASQVAHVTAGDQTIKVFADLHYADWLLWRLPQLRGRVAFDARLELQPAGRLDRLARSMRATGIDWKRPADGFRLVVLAPRDVKDAARGYRAETGRRILFDDADGLVILRSPAASR
jgi:hypothetical protein